LAGNETLPGKTPRQADGRPDGKAGRYDLGEPVDPASRKSDPCLEIVGWELPCIQAIVEVPRDAIPPVLVQPAREVQSVPNGVRKESDGADEEQRWLLRRFPLRQQCISEEAIQDQKASVTGPDELGLRGPERDRSSVKRCYLRRELRDFVLLGRFVHKKCKPPLS